MEEDKNGFEEKVKSLNEIRKFLQSAPSLFGPNDRIKRHELPNAEIVSCIKWDEEYFISGIDILRCIIYRFSAFGREVMNRSRFEEFVFSDLRSLKSNVRVRLEEGKSELLEFLHTNGCIRTKKKQRVFYWDAVPHEQLFLDSLERELRRSVVDDSNNEIHCVTVALREPALSLQYDPLVKVAHQIPNIIREAAPEHVSIMCAVFGVPLPKESNDSDVSRDTISIETRSENSPISRPCSSDSDHFVKRLSSKSSFAVGASSQSTPVIPSASFEPLEATVPPMLPVLLSPQPSSASSTKYFEFQRQPIYADPCLPLPPARKHDINLPHIQDILPPNAQFDLSSLPEVYSSNRDRMTESKYKSIKTKKSPFKDRRKW